MDIHLTDAESTADNTIFILLTLTPVILLVDYARCTEAENAFNGTIPSELGSILDLIDLFLGTVKT